MSENDLKYWVWLSSIPGLGSRNCLKLLKYFGSPKNLWNADEKEILNLHPVRDTLMNKLLDEKCREKTGLYIENIKKWGIKAVTIEDEDYPQYLKDIYDPPIVLYTRGILKDEKTIAVVGSRRATSYGLTTAEKISSELAKNGITVISGMARGVDSYAHNGALNAGGRTVAVLGCGPDIVYPPENERLMERIMNNGAVLSEFLPGIPPLAQNFPARNRIISGMSMGVVVIEANEKSGSLITANFALDQGREVFAVPGNLTSYNSKGSNRLIKDGAKMVMSIEDILEELSQFGVYGSNAPVGAGLKKTGRDSWINRLEGEEKILAKCLELEPMHIDTLVKKTGLSIQNVSAILVMLELQGMVIQLPGKIFKLAE